VGPLFGLGSALLFGLSIPLIKLIIESIDSWLMAGILYLGAMTGILLLLLLLSVVEKKNLFKIPLSDIPWLLLATLFGGLLGPVLLMLGITHSEAATASLLLNLEGVFGAALAWFVFKEHFDQRILIGMILIVLGGVLLSIQGNDATLGFNLNISSLYIVLACLAWGLDNNFTRKISTSNSLTLTFYKTLIAGVTNTTLALYSGVSLPSMGLVLKSMTIGFFCYGLSLVLYVRALRFLGASRTGAYFSMAPFVGAVISWLFFPMSFQISALAGGFLMAVGVYLHLTEKHEHRHKHFELAHSHSHTHDEHHQHSHSSDESEQATHTHWHVHIELEHEHEHFPDIHHQHSHS
jgi:drug/metabolite transporter (DMT)-like permease